MSFERLAPHYVWMERVLAGSLLQSCRTTWFEQLAGRRRLLVAGVGPGNCLGPALAGHPGLKVTALDASPAMLRVAERRARQAGWDASRLSFVCASLPDWRGPAGGFDAIATPFFLDCFDPGRLRSVVTLLANAAAGEAVWLHTDFAVPAGGWRRLRALAIHRLMYGFFRTTTGLSARRLTSPDALLAEHGFVLRGRSTFNHGLLRADWWERSGARFEPIGVGEPR